MRFVGKNVKMDGCTFIGDNIILLGYVTIETGVIIEDGSMIGKPSDAQLEQLRGNRNSPLSFKDYDEIVDTKTVIKKNCYVGRHSTVYSGSTLQEGVICKDYTLIGWDSTIDEKSKLMFYSQVHSWVSVGKGCRIGGFCCNDAKLGNYVSMFGNLIHAYREYGGKRREPAPRIGDNVTIGFGAQVIGGVSVGNDSYIAAGSIVTKKVPPNTVVTLQNKHCHIKDWHGRLGMVRRVHKEGGT